MALTVDRRTPQRPLDRQLSQLRRLGRIELDRRTTARVGLVAVLSLVAIAAIATFGRPYDFFDLRIYHGAVAYWAHGGDIYEYIYPNTTLGYTYPPFAAIAMLPMAFTSTTLVIAVNTAASLVVIGVCAYWALGPIADRHGWHRGFAVALAIPIATATDPVRETLGYGQINVLLAGLVLADLYALRRGLWWAGLGTGLATAIKVTPAVFLIYFLVTRQWRAALTSAGAALGATLLGFAVTTNASLHYWTIGLWQTSRVGALDAAPNQSLAGLLARLYDMPSAPGLVWFTFALLVLAVGLTRAANAHGEGDELAAFTLVGLTANAVSPISWTHHLVWVVPAGLILADVALRRRSLRYAFAAGALYALFVVAPVWQYEHRAPVSHWSDGPLGMLAESSFAIAVLALIVLMPWRPSATPVQPKLADLGVTGVQIRTKVHHNS